MNINKAAMDLIGDLQMIPPEQAYERTKKALDEAFKAGLLKAIELCHANEMSHLYIWQRIQREHDKLP